MTILSIATHSTNLALKEIDTFRMMMWLTGTLQKDFGSIQQIDRWGWGDLIISIVGFENKLALSLIWQVRVKNIYGTFCF